MYEKPLGSRWLVLLGILGMTAGTCWSWFQIPQLRSDLAVTEPLVTWTYAELFADGPGEGRHVRIQDVAFDNLQRVDVQQWNATSRAYVPIQSSGLFEEQTRLIARLPRHELPMGTTDEALAAESTVQGVLLPFPSLGLAAQSQLQQRLPNIDPATTWIIEKDKQPVTPLEAWSMAGLPLVLVSLGWVLMGSQPASAIRWLYLLNPIGFGLTTLVGYPFRHAGKHFRGIGLMMLAIGIGFLAWAYSTALPDGKQLTDSDVQLFSAVLMVTLGGAFSLGGLLRFLRSPFRPVQRNAPICRRPKISAEVLCGN